MCMSCGCGEPHERHGDKRNIVYADLKAAGAASKISVKEAVQNIQKTLRAKNPRMPARS
jgi:prepilin-type processing-associated H-X9-DG protein